MTGVGLVALAIVTAAVADPRSGDRAKGSTTTGTITEIVVNRIDGNLLDDPVAIAVTGPTLAAVAALGNTALERQEGEPERPISRRSRFRVVM